MNQYARILLRVALAFTFLYAAFGAFIEPLNWIGYFPAWMQHIVPQEILVLLFSLYEIILAAWLVWGKGLLYASLAASASLFAITVVNVAVFDVVFRDVGLGLAALALAVASMHKFRNI